MRITKQQAQSLYNKWVQNDQGVSYLVFRRSAEPTFGYDDAIVVKWCGMWLCIETDGYCHT